jgi:hypothetical protein
MSLILSYNDGLAKGKKRVPNIRKEPHIERGFTKFKLDYGKCRSYLDIHLPIFYNKSMCELTDAIIERCRAIMIRVLYNGSLDYNEDSVLDLSYGGWVSNMNKSQLFIEMFLKESIVMEIKTMHALDNEDELSWDSEDYSYYSLREMLFDDEKYAEFNHYWQDCSIGALLTTLTLSSRRILIASAYFSAGFPREISEKIIYHAFDMLD